MVFRPGISVQSQRCSRYATHRPDQGKTLSRTCSRCTGSRSVPATIITSPLWRQKFNQITYGYGFNIYGLITNGVGKTLADLRDPSHIICFADTAQVNTFQPPASSTHPMLEEWYYVSYTSFGDLPDVHFRHNGFANVLFCDGHVTPWAWPRHTESHLPQQKVGRLNSNGDTSLSR